MNQYSSNPHILKLSTNIAEKEQIMALIAEAIQHSKSDILKYYPPGYLFQYQVKIVSNSRGLKFGFAYVWFKEVEIRHALLGLRLDGSPSVEYYDDPNWTPPAPKKELTWEEMMQEELPENWGDLIDLEEGQTCPQLRRVLPPIMELPKLILPPKDYEEYVEFMISSAKWNETWVEGTEIPLPTEGVTLVAEEVKIKHADKSGVIPNVLCATSVPDWVKEEDIYHLFVTYVTDPKKCYYLKDPRTRKQVKYVYPTVSINRSKKGSLILTVTFDPDTRDAFFALLMTRRTDFTKGSNSTTLYFDHALSR